MRKFIPFCHDKKIFRLSFHYTIIWSFLHRNVNSKIAKFLKHFWKKNSLKDINKSNYVEFSLEHMRIIILKLFKKLHSSCLSLKKKQKFFHHKNFKNHLKTFLVLFEFKLFNKYFAISLFHLQLFCCGSHVSSCKNNSLIQLRMSRTFCFTIGVVLVSLMLTLNIFHTLF